MMEFGIFLVLCLSTSYALILPTSLKEHLEPETLSMGTKLFSARNKRQAEQEVEPNCNFGNGDDVDLCQWMNNTRSAEIWEASKGENAGWLGGPSEDETSSNTEGGYALFETSKLVDNAHTLSLPFDSAMLMSPVLERTKAIGSCVNFWYAMDGLSQDKLRILLRPPSSRVEKILNTNITKDDLQIEFMDSDGRDDIVLWENKDSTDGKWINGQLVYTFNNRHMLIIEGLPLNINDPNRAYRGYITVDDLSFVEASECKLFCNFEGGFCSWTQDENDDFDWSLSRGSMNPSTGPPMDRFSFNYGIKGGGYVFIDSGYPRRPFDKARIISDAFEALEPDIPLCMRFWTHMYGHGVGYLRVITKPDRGEEEIIWELKRDQGNKWYQGQVTISSDTKFQIVIEAEVGINNLGDIAIDEITIKENACPTSPQTASKYKGDCTFEVDECGWRNFVLRGVDELDWVKSTASSARTPNVDHTLKTSQGSYMTLPRNSVQRGERGWLTSEPMKPDANGKALCLTFWYYMYDPFIEQTGPSLGSLRVMITEQEQGNFNNQIVLWELKNQQGPSWKYGQVRIESEKTFVVIFEGLWGNSRGSEFIAIDDITFFSAECSTMPKKAQNSLLNCDFTRGSCSYSNSTASTGGERWLISTISRRPSTLSDHTYGGPVGYIYFDMFSRNNNDPPKISLMSDIVKASLDNDLICITFWYAPIGNRPETFLSVNRESADASANTPDSNSDTPTTIWKIAASDVYTDRIEWMFGQVDVEATTDFKITFLGEAREGGFALDDIRIYPSRCNRRPEKSDPFGRNNDDV